MLTQTPSQTEISSAYMVRYVFQCLQQYEAFLPAEARMWAEDNNAFLAVLESWVATAMKKQLARVLAPPGR